ncbi:MAG: hypothetical protein ROW52_10335, partial [Anaerolineaceae bacterium]
MKPKTYLMWSLLVVMVMIIVACQPAATPAPQEADAQKFLLGMVQHSSIPYTQQMRDGFEAACKDIGAD